MSACNECARAAISAVLDINVVDEVARNRTRGKIASERLDKTVKLLNNAIASLEAAEKACKVRVSGQGSQQTETAYQRARTLIREQPSVAAELLLREGQYNVILDGLAEAVNETFLAKEGMPCANVGG